MEMERMTHSVTPLLPQSHPTITSCSSSTSLKAIATCFLIIFFSVIALQVDGASLTPKTSIVKLSETIAV